MSALDFLFKRESADDHLANKAVAGDFNMDVSPLDGHLVGVAEVGGVRVCCYCLDPFVEDPRHKHRPVEFRLPGLSSSGQNYDTRMKIHACCAGAAQKRPSFIQKRINAHQAARFAARAVKPILAAQESAKNSDDK